MQWNNLCDNMSVSGYDFYTICEQTGSDKRYFSDEIKALYRSTYVEKRTLLRPLKYHDMIKVYISGINGDIKECLFAAFDMSAVYVLYGLCTFFRDTELHTGD